MEQLASSTSNTNTARNARQFFMVAAILVPALFFWTLLALVGMGVYVFIAALDDTENTCTIAHIPLHGILTTTSGGYADLFDMGYTVSSESVVERITEADADDSIHALLIDIDSPGGTPVAGDEIAEALHNAHKPTIALVRDMGASAAYWAAAGADYIIASPVSDVGSIGVTMSYTEIAGEREEEGARWISLSSGTFKDAGNPERALTQEEEEYFQGQVDAVHEYMIDRIATLRPTLTKEAYAKLADGKAYLGMHALTNGLIDAVGGMQEAIAHLAESLGTTPSDEILCPLQTGSWDLLW